MGFVPAVGAVVIGHFSLSGKLLKEHFNMETEQHTNLFNSDQQEIVAEDSIPISVLTPIINTLSYEGHCVIDATSGNGM